MDSYGSGLSQEVINQRIKNNDFEASRTNYAAIRYVMSGDEYIDVMRNDPGGLHSEEKLVAKYSGRDDIDVKEVYSERRPCEGCDNLLGKFPPKVTYGFSYSRQGKAALQNALNRFKG